MPTNLIEIVQAQNWAIIPEKLDAIHQVLANHANGKKIEYEADQKPAAPYQVIDRVAVIPIHGVIAKRMNMMQQFSGGVSTEIVGRDIKAALDDPDIISILLDIDSPGGTVDGTEALAEMVFQAREVKPIVAFANGMMASAAYWIGSGAQTIITNETGDIGSIGVVQAHYDYSEANEKAGVTQTYIYAGKYKTIGNDSEPLSKEGKAYIQAGVDYIYSLFVESVSRHREVTIAEALKMAEGRIFIGKQALEVGLVDQIGNFDTALDVSQAMGFENYFYGKTSTGAKTPIIKEGNDMPNDNKGVTLEKLESDAPVLLGEIRQAAINGVDLEPSMKEGAEKERKKILALAEVHFAGDDGKFAKLVESGASVEMYQAMKDAMPEPAKAEKSEKMDEMLEEIQNSGSENPGAGAGATGPKNFTEAWHAVKEEKGCSTEDAMKQAVRDYPELHKTFIGESGNA
jgi:capsid assembly protease